MRAVTEPAVGRLPENFRKEMADLMAVKINRPEPAHAWRVNHSPGITPSRQKKHF